jgi:hypothetical protein
MIVTIRGRKWNLKRVRVANGTDGDCDQPDVPKREIRVSPSLRGERELEVMIHEMLHASYWDLSEEAVDTAAEDIARALWKLGYRKQ